MRAWILIGSLAAAVGAAACGAQAASPFANSAAGQTALRCEPGQHAVVNQAFADGATLTSVSCAADLLAPVATQPAYRGAYQTQPVAYRPVAAQPAYRGAYQTQAVAYQPAAVAQPALVRSAPARTSTVVVEQKPRRTWQKRAIVIGGSSGAGAGIGALIGGKKGALIGAAIGAGGGTVYEMNKK